MTIDLTLITYNRLYYTKLALASILADEAEHFTLSIWDNASEDGTTDFLRSLSDSRIREIVYSPRNVGQTAALNALWNSSKADLLGKLDNDCIVTPGWTRKLAKAHREIENLGAIACWHFLPEDFNYQAARKKIFTYGSHQVLRHPWTCGTGLLLKRSTFQKFGPFRDKATTEYWLNISKYGFINGFYYPLIFQDHMDDLRSPNNILRSEHSMSFEDAYKHSYGYNIGAMKDKAGSHRLHSRILRRLMCGPWEAEYYCGPKYKRFIGRFITLINGYRFGI